MIDSKKLEEIRRLAKEDFAQGYINSYAIKPAEIVDLIDTIDWYRTNTVSYDDLAEFLGKDEMRKIADQVRNKYGDVK